MRRAVDYLVIPTRDLGAQAEEHDRGLPAVSEDDEGDPKPEFLDTLRRRRERIAETGEVVASNACRRGKG